MHPSPDFKRPELKKISDVIWEIPVSYKKGMLVPARIYATKELLDAMDQGVFEQVTNVACLPGIQKYAFCMPDGHWGYGFPIGGVAAFDPEQGGIISPGGVGFDINCLHPEEKVSLQQGVWKRIKDLDTMWAAEKLPVFDKKTRSLHQANLLAYMKREEHRQLYQITTLSGKTLRVTGEHPILTYHGMVRADCLKEQDLTVMHGFEGIEWQQPPHQKIVGKDDILAVLDRLYTSNKGNARNQILKVLKNKGLLELFLDSPKLPILLKLMGFILGDGSISFVNKKEWLISFYGKKEDLEDIRADIIALGFQCKNVYERMRNHSITTYYKTVAFTFNEQSISQASTALAVLLLSLGAPYGKKVASLYRVPRWIMSAPLWQKRLFLSSFFGAELSTPRAIAKCNLGQPTLNMNKLETLQENAIDFLNDIRLLLADFSVTSAAPVPVNGYQYRGKQGKTVGFRITLQENTPNLLRFFETVSYEYNKHKKAEAAVAASYLRVKSAVQKERQAIRQKAKELYTEGAMSQSQIVQLFNAPYTSAGFIQHSIWDDFKNEPRSAKNFISFEEYKRVFSVGGGLVFDPVLSITTTPYHGHVYDVTVNNENHNFIASGIVISNCGMRLVTTSLTLDEVQPKLKQLVDLLFKRVPAGVGCTGFVKVTEDQFKDVLRKGSRWCVENGYGWKEDLERTEDEGCIAWADPSKISDKAIKRGIGQLGTLGSGNHYLEIQVASPENILDKKLAAAMGITKPNQICIMVHCGSRGFGHQIGTDYLKLFLDAMPKYGIAVHDKELACAPFNSKEGQEYYAAMACAANMAFANRQVILHRIRECFSEIFGKTPEELEIHLVYDVAHNIAKVEEHVVDGKKKKLVVHRKGSTRCFGPGREELLDVHKKIGQPVILGGSMETGSYLLVGTKKAEEETFGSTAHGSGRTMSRTQAVREFRGEKLQKDMEKRGIYVKAVSMSGLAEEAGAAYKNITDVIDTMDKAGVSKPVVKLLPIGNVKG
ncbi:RtcB family protein [Candidatus Woesearchaeota archaeon]|nr:RtcB family protein [Candidatus Woesearchaeota archaeon]